MATSTRFVQIDGLANFRDLGGFRTADGVVRHGVLYRSDGLHQASELGLDALAKLGCATVIDLRTTPEHEEWPGPFPAVHLPLHEELAEQDIPDAMTISGRRGGESWLEGLYRLLIERATEQFAEVFAILADDGRLPAIVHCAGGKDRTGITVALVLEAIGVDRDEILDDFALQSDDPEWERRRAALHASLVERGIEPDAAHALVTAPRVAMEGALRFLDERYGGIEGYLGDACGLDGTLVARVRANLVEAARL